MFIILLCTCDSYHPGGFTFLIMRALPFTFRTLTSLITFGSIYITIPNK